MDILKIAAFGIAGVLLVLPLKKEKGDYAMLLSMAVCTCIFLLLLAKLETILDFAQRLEGLLTIDSRYIALLVKMVGITYVAEFAIQICRDAGFGAIASQIELFAKLSILAVSVPVLTAFLETIGSFL